MTDNKKKGDFNKGGKDDIGGDKKQRANRNEDSRTGNQNSGSGPGIKDLREGPRR